MCIMRDGIVRLDCASRPRAGATFCGARACAQNTKKTLHFVSGQLRARACAQKIKRKKISRWRNCGRKRSAARQLCAHL
jgi:hypothetical protein